MANINKVHINILYTFNVVLPVTIDFIILILFSSVLFKLNILIILEHCDIYWKWTGNYQQSSICERAVPHFSTTSTHNQWALGFCTITRILGAKRAIINVRNEDNRSFGYALLSAYYPNQIIPNRVANYNRFFHHHCLDKLPYPILPAQIPILETCLKVSINLFTFSDNEGKSRLIQYVSNLDYTNHVDLLVWKNHYAWIKHFHRFACDAMKKKKNRYYCRWCIQNFYSLAGLMRHIPQCSHPFVKPLE